MRKIQILILVFFTMALHAENKLDLLDKQSRDFFKAITGLEKNYLEKQIKDIQTKEKVKIKDPNKSNNSFISSPSKKEEKISQEEFEKNIFRHQNDMARLTSEFTRSKQLKDIKIKSMYSFNGSNYVVLKNAKKEEEEAKENSELSLDIEGRYKQGDYILTHKIININRRTKTIKLFKKLDENYGYYIDLSNYGISVSKLEKKQKKQIQKKDVKSSFVSVNSINTKAKNNMKKEISKDNKNKKISCLYTVMLNKLNVRNTPMQSALILRVLRSDDQFTINQRKNDWVQIDTIYKKMSGDVMLVENKNNWVQLTRENVSANENTCN